MANKADLKIWIIGALKYKNGSATLLEICKFVWEHYELELRNSGDLFYTWQYDIRWAATSLRDNGKLKPAKLSPRGIWELL